MQYSETSKKIQILTRIFMEFSWIHGSVFRIISWILHGNHVYELKEVSLVQRTFRTEYPKDDTPSHSVIKNILSNFKKHGLVAHVPLKSKNSGQKREMVKNQPENLVSDFPQLWIRKAASGVGVSPTLVYYIFHDDMNLKPYKFHLYAIAHN